MCTTVVQIRPTLYLTLYLSLRLSGCHLTSSSSFEVPRSLFSVPEGFCPADKTLIRGCVDTITLILCPCRCQVSRKIFLTVQSPKGCRFPLHIPPGAGKHQGIRKTSITFAYTFMSFLLQKLHAPQLPCLDGWVMHSHPLPGKLRVQARKMELP